ncbi:MAG: endonuclease MutS2, partial [Flavobacteriaceae bacterium]
ELLRIVETENSKRNKKSVRESREEKKKQNRVEQEVQQKMEKIRRQKERNNKIKAKQNIAKPRPDFQVGDRVRLIDGKAVGSIDSLEKNNKAVVNYGMFTTNVSVDQLELVESRK